jgi:hypothetical protein
MALRGERKTIEKKHLSFLADYIGKKTLRTVDFAPLLNEPDNAQSKLEEFNSVMGSGDLERINQWFGESMNSKSWRTMWLAEKGRSHRRDNPRSEQTLRKELAESVKEWAGTDDINEAVRALLEAVKNGR